MPPNIFSSHNPVEGLRESENPGDCRVYRMKKDGSRGKLIRIVKEAGFNPKFTGYHNYRQEDK